MPMNSILLKRQFSPTTKWKFKK